MRSQCHILGTTSSFSASSSFSYFPLFLLPFFFRLSPPPFVLIYAPAPPFSPLTILLPFPSWPSPLLPPLPDGAGRGGISLHPFPSTLSPSPPLLSPFSLFSPLSLFSPSLVSSPPPRPPRPNVEAEWHLRPHPKCPLPAVLLRHTSHPPVQPCLCPHPATPHYATHARAHSYLPAACAAKLRHLWDTPRQATPSHATSRHATHAIPVPISTCLQHTKPHYAIHGARHATPQHAKPTTEATPKAYACQVARHTTPRHSPLPCSPQHNATPRYNRLSHAHIASR